MADEKKTYLINIESNLAQYAKDAVDAKEEVDKLTVANKELKESGTASAEQLETNQAALKLANEEYRKAQGLLKTAISNNASETGSRKQLEQQLKLQMQALGKLGNAYITDAKGILVLNPLYAKQRAEIEATKSAIIKYDQALKDGRSNVGNYASALNGAMSSISAIPGPVGRAASSIESLSTQVSKINPIVAVIGGGLLAISAPLMAFFKYSEEGIELLERKVSGFKAAIGVLRGELIKLGKDMLNIGKSPDNKPTIFGAIWNDIKGTSGKIGEVTTKMDAAAKAAEAWKAAQQQLEEVEIGLIVTREESNLNLARTTEIYNDETKSRGERIAALKENIRLEDIQNTKEIAAARQKTIIISLIRDQGLATLQWTDAQEREFKQALANEVKLEAASLGRTKRTQMRIKTLMDELDKAGKDALAKEKEMYDAIIANTIKAWKTAEKMRDDFVKAEEKRQSDKSKDIRKGLLGTTNIDELDASAENRADSITAYMEAQRIMAGNDLNLLESLLDEEYQLYRDSEQFKKDSYGRQLLAESQYVAAKQSFADTRKQMMNEEISAAANLAGTMSEILGRETAAGKAFAVAQAIMSTYTGAAMALADPLGTAATRLISAAAIVLQGLAYVQQILAVPTSGSGSSSAISSSPATTRVTAPTVGASVLSQATMSQSQANVLSAQNMLTAKDIAAEIAKLPSPVVTVEDINARTKSVVRVAERANI
jgi:hypothetical protein